MATRLRRLRAAIGALRGRAAALEELLLTRRLARHGVALSRILAGTAYAGLLLTNFEHRNLLFGSAAGWVSGYRDVYPEGAWVGLLAAAPGWLFTTVYLGVVAAAFALILGWHARVAGVLVLVGAFQIIELDPLAGDQGDNVLRIGLALLLLTDFAGVWSLDARRRRRRDREPRRRAPALGALRTLLHNAGVIALAGQLVVIYVAAGMYKVGGDAWQYGTAISYPLRLDEYRSLPVLDDLVVGSWFLVWLATYAAVYLQLFFPVLLLNRITRRIALVAVIGLHLGIATLMGLPWFSLAMVAFDGIFISERSYLAVDRAVRRAGAVRRWRGGREAPDSEVVGPEAVG